MKRRRLFVLPRNHRPAMMVPMGGAACANCRFLSGNREGPRCGNRYYRRWAKTDLFLNPETGAEVEPQSFCCDWYEPRSL